MSGETDFDPKITEASERANVRSGEAQL